MTRRTTLSLDDDVATRLREEPLRTGKPLKTLVNEAIRAGLDSGIGRPKPFRVVARDMGRRPGIDLGDIEGLLDRIEGPDRR